MSLHFDSVSSPSMPAILKFTGPSKMSLIGKTSSRSSQRRTGSLGKVPIATSIARTRFACRRQSVTSSDGRRFIGSEGLVRTSHSIPPHMILKDR